MADLEKEETRRDSIQLDSLKDAQLSADFVTREFVGGSSLSAETWTFTLEDGSTVVKSVAVY